MEKTYLLFKANCIGNPDMTGDLQYYSKYHYTCGNSYTHPEIEHSIPFDDKHPAIQFENELVTDRKFNPQNQCKNGASAYKTVLMIWKEGNDYKITISFADKTIDKPKSEDRWETENFKDAWGLSQKEINSISKRLISFYDEYFELKQMRQLSIKYLTKKYLVEIW